MTMMLRTLLICGLALGWTDPAPGQTPRPIQFNRDVRPILSDACFQCHGPDKAKRKAKLHFDTEDGARIDLGGHFAIVPGKQDDSELIGRITTSDKSKQMPPPSAAVSLTAPQIETLKRWIAEGAKWQKHWAFIPPVRPGLPSVKNKAWPRNAIDHFVLARLEAEGLTSSPEAEPATLIRRMSLDLTGLPPTPVEVDDFVAEWDAASAKRQAAVEKLADRLLASPRFGERMAQRWLDAARYADTNGYQTDGERTMWRWRDWVIDAYNANMPFDRFTIEQIAGDMLPGATLEQKIATGFNRNHRGNSEGGVIPEEYAVEYVVDRVDTTSTVWLGLAAGCARCHDHKYDPLSQKEFYQLFAYFNNVPERGKAIKYGNSPPYIQSPTREQAKKLAELQAALEVEKKRMAAFEPKLAELERLADPKSRLDYEFTRDRVAFFRLGDLRVHNRNPIKAVHGKPEVVNARRSTAIELDGASWLDGGDVGGFGFMDKFSFGAWVNPTARSAGPVLSRMVDSDRAEGYCLSLIDGKVHVSFVKRWLDDAIRIETVENLQTYLWHHVFVTYDGSRAASGIKVYVNGKLAKVKVNLDDLNQNFQTTEPFRIGAGSGSRFHGILSDLSIFNDVVPPEDVAVLAKLAPGGRTSVMLNLPPESRSQVQRRVVRLHFLEYAAPTGIRKTYSDLLKAEKDLEKYDASLPTTMVMQEMPTPRDTHILLRGEYDKKGIKVLPGVPAAFAPLPKGAPNHRLGFAKWLVASENPLTARVAVNRHWQMLFGAGIVRSVEDFGGQGDWPSHPELLDWLAVEFVGDAASVANDKKATLAASPTKWDVRRLLKLIVTSATYRQSSRITPTLRQKDPDNRLLARGPRFRLSADVIRDQALFASGLLVEQRGGPSVRPYQPAGLAKELTGTEDFVQDHGPSLYRRSLYTFWKRTIAPATLMNFDAANRETCVVRETRTNTPLQALNLMNDVTFVEAARVLAERVMKVEKSPSPRLALAWRLAVARPPSLKESKLLLAAFEHHHAHYRDNPAAALKLVNVGEAPRDRRLDVAEHSAYAAVCNMILNLDEVITKE